MSDQRHLYRALQYFDDEGRTVIHKECITDAALSSFIGRLNIQIKTPQGVLTHPLEFPLEVSDIYQAFEIYDGEAEKNKAQFQSKMESMARRHTLQQGVQGFGQ